MGNRLSSWMTGLAAVLCASALAAGAEEHASRTGKSDPQSFVQNAAQDGMLEVELGKIAQQKSQNPQVQKFGARMVKDHGKANAELASIAKQQNLEVPTQLDRKHQKMVQEMRGKSGTEFDLAYAEHMAKDHSKAVDLFKEASRSDDPQIAGFAKKTLPTLEEHKSLADSMVTETRTAAAKDSETPARR